MATKPIFDDVPAWPDKAAPAPAHIGHNKPPLEELIPVEFRAELLRERPDFLTKLNDLIAAADRAKAEDDATLGKCGDLVKAYRACASHIDATHKAVKEPHLVAGRLVDAEKNALAGRLTEAKAKVEAIGNAFVAKREAEQRAERERIAAEQRAAAERAAQAERDRVAAEQEAARAAAEATTQAERDAAAERAAQAAREAEEAMAAASLAPATAARAEPVRSDAGATVSGKQDWACEVEDYAAAFRAVKSDPKVKEAIDAAVKRLVRAGQRELKGVRVWPVAKANFR
jgi:hypothetical protein